MEISQKGINLIKKFEGKHLEAYLCPAGVPTIGYGHTGRVNGKPVALGMKISEKEAEDLLKKDLKMFEKGVLNCVKVPLSQGQFDALVSFSYNLGIGNLQKSTLLRLLNKKKYDEAAEQFKCWVKAGNTTLNGLVKRRKAEKKLFLS